MRKTAATSEIKRTSCRIFRETVELKIEKRILGASIGLREVSDWILWRGRPLRNKRRDVKSTALGKEGNSGKPVGYSGPIALRREQCGM
jgi:hypothetical protein